MDIVATPNVPEKSPSRAATVFAALLYAAVFHWAYISVIHAAFDYAFYTYHEPSWPSAISTYCFVAFPLIAHSRSRSPASMGVYIIYTICYVTSQIMLLCMWEYSALLLAATQASLALSMMLMFYCGRIWFNEGFAIIPDRLSRGILVMTVTTTLIMVYFYKDYMRLVSFADVYDLRSETSAVVQPTIVMYLSMWLPYAFIPYHLARGLFSNRKADLIVGLSASLIIYSATGSKAAVLLPVIMIGFKTILNKADMLRAILWRVSALVSVVLVLPGDSEESVFFWAKSILMVRIFGTPGWTIYYYYQYFREHGYTYYTHIGPVNAIFGGYPYGELALGQLIGIEYSGSVEANFNANFWASDAFAAMGIAGMPFITAAMCLVLVAFNRAASGYSSSFVTMWLCGFWLALLNVPLTTALLSCGGLIVMFSLWYMRRDHERHRTLASAPRLSG